MVESIPSHPHKLQHPNCCLPPNYHSPLSPSVLLLLPVSCLLTEKSNKEGEHDKIAERIVMARATQSMISASSCALPSCHKVLSRSDVVKRRNSRIFFSAASANQEDDSDCNTEECAPDKEVGKVSVEWLAGEKTKVVGTFPPKKKGWTGYVEKDTAGQTNIYSVEPAVYVAESAISSGNAGSSSDGAENTAALAAGLALISIAAASSILLQVGKNVPQLQATEYSGPPLTYYINKFKPVSIVEAAAPIEVQESPSIQADTSASSESPQVGSSVEPSGGSTS